MDSTGFIEDIGVPGSTIVNPSVGLAVAKSGRMTDLPPARSFPSTPASVFSIRKGAIQGRNSLFPIPTRLSSTAARLAPAAIRVR